jgi:hypothetical protein
MAGELGEDQAWQTLQVKRFNEIARQYLPACQADSKMRIDHE